MLMMVIAGKMMHVARFFVLFRINFAGFVFFYITVVILTPTSEHTV